MIQKRRIVHILDDLAMGGVTRALDNFSHPDLAAIGHHETVDIRSESVRATSPDDIAIVHFTANWKKLGSLVKLRQQSGFSSIILIEHSYTDGFERSEVTASKRFRFMLQCAYRLVDTVIAVSAGQRNWMLEARLARPEKIITIAQSRPCNDLLKLPLRSRDAGPLKIGAFGRFHRQKGFDLLLSAMAMIPAELAELKLAGTGPEDAALRAQAAGLPHVEICPPFESPEHFLSEIDLVAIPSRWEAFGLVGTEARASGRPILAAKIDGLVDQLDAQSFAHQCGSVTSIAQGIRRAAVATDFDRRSAAVRQSAATEYDQMIANWVDILSQKSQSAPTAA